VGVRVDVGSGVLVGTLVGVRVAVAVAVLVGVAVLVAVEVLVAVGVLVDVEVLVAVAVFVGVSVDVLVGVEVDVAVAVGVDVWINARNCWESQLNSNKAKIPMPTRPNAFFISAPPLSKYPPVPTHMLRAIGVGRKPIAVGKDSSSRLNLPPAAVAPGGNISNTRMVP
jgi:hypothetical protein